MVVVVMGVSGSGKTTVGRALAADRGWRFVDADDLHPPANIAKMSHNEPLTDADRGPWLLAVRAQIAGAIASRDPLVLACSALKRSYRHTLSDGLRDVAFVYLHADEALLKRRLENRKGHFAGAGLVRSQLATVEPPSPDDALILDAMLPPEELVKRITDALGI